MPALVLKSTLLGLGLSIIVHGHVWAQVGSAEDRTLKLAFHSEVLNEAREILVRLPEGYLDDTETHYPVFFVTDADWNFDLIAATLDFHARWGRIPGFITVGAMNVNRNRDFVPRADPGYPFTGAGDRYLDHLNQELLPLIDENYRSSEHRVIFGHSFGGVMTLNQMLRDASVFEAHIAVGTSTWVADGVLFERTLALLDAQGSLDTFLFLSVGEGDGGATVPEGERYADLLAERAPESLEWSHAVFPAENHFTNVPISLHEGLRALFPFFDQAADLTQQVEREGASGVKRWFERKQDELGWRFVPQSMELGLAAIQMATSGSQAAATEVFDRLEARDPDRPETIAYRAIALGRTGRTEAAIEAIDRAIVLGERVDHPASRMASFQTFRESMVRDD